jgi:hypothetical protein
MSHPFVRTGSRQLVQLGKNGRCNEAGGIPEETIDWALLALQPFCEVRGLVIHVSAKQQVICEGLRSKSDQQEGRTGCLHKVTAGDMYNCKRK